MNLAFLKFDFPDLERHEALLLVTNELKAHAYYIEDGKIVGVRNRKLSALYIELGRQALVGLGRKLVADFRERNARDAAEIDNAKPGPKRPGRQNRSPRGRS